MLKQHSKKTFEALSRLLTLVLLASIMMSCASLGIPNMSETSLEDAQFMDGDILIQNDALYGITIVGFHDNFDFLYEPNNPMSLAKAGEAHPYRYIMNGSYFEGSRIHAGWLSIFGVEHTPIKADRQLSHLAVLDTALSHLEFPSLDLWDSTMTREQTLEFQTGPLVIYANQVDTLSIEASINGTGAHLRTLLAYTEEDGMIYFIITRKVCTLNELGTHLLTLTAFQGKTLHVMNLDGGSSTALYARNHPELNFNTSRHLPILLGVR